METVATIVTMLVALGGVVAYLDRKIDGVRVELKADFDRRFDQVDDRFSRMDDRFDRMDDRFDRMDDRFDRMDERFNRLEDRVQGLDDRVFALATGMKPLIDQAQQQPPL